jgi:hypothetical protein
MIVGQYVVHPQIRNFPSTKVLVFILVYLNILANTRMNFVTIVAQLQNGCGVLAWSLIKLQKDSRTLKKINIFRWMIELNRQELHSYYTFNPRLPLGCYLKKKCGESLKPRYTLSEILTMIKLILRDGEMFDFRNPAMILCDKEMETVFDMKAMHVTEIRKLITSQLIRLPDIVQTVMKRKAALNKKSTSDHPIPPMKKRKYETIIERADFPVAIQLVTDNEADHSSGKLRKLSWSLDPAIYADKNALFKLKPELRATLSSLPSFPHAEMLLNYDTILKLVSSYIVSKKLQFIDPRNFKVALIKGDPLSYAFNCDAFHRSQVASLVRKQLTYVMIKNNPDQVLSINVRLTTRY